jgi:hypothetical protein
MKGKSTILIYLTEEDLKEIEQIMREILEKAKAKTVVLVDKEGIQVISTFGYTNENPNICDDLEGNRDISIVGDCFFLVIVFDNKFSAYDLVFSVFAEYQCIIGDLLCSISHRLKNQYFTDDTLIKLLDKITDEDLDYLFG